MRRFLTWLTVRRMMLLVALMAIALGAALFPGRIADREVWRSYHSTRARELREIVGDWRQGKIHGVGAEESGSVADWIDECISHHQAMSRKWEEAARYPWITVEPDPPEPDWVWLPSPPGGSSQESIPGQSH